MLTQKLFVRKELELSSNDTTLELNLKSKISGSVYDSHEGTHQNSNLKKCLVTM